MHLTSRASANAASSVSSHCAHTEEARVDIRRIAADTPLVQPTFLLTVGPVRTSSAADSVLSEAGFQRPASAAVTSQLCSRCGTCCFQQDLFLFSDLIPGPQLHVRRGLRFGDCGLLFDALLEWFPPKLSGLRWPRLCNGTEADPPAGASCDFTAIRFEQVQPAPSDSCHSETLSRPTQREFTPVPCGRKNHSARNVARSFFRPFSSELGVCLFSGF